MQWFDAGVNLLDSRFNPDQVIDAALNAGVDQLCVITTAPDEWAVAADLYHQYPDVICYTVGVHPHNAKLVEAHHLAQLREAARAPGVVAIGECGLDFNRNFSPPDVQREVFTQQLALAAELKLPVYLHERDAHEQQLACLDAWAGQLVGGIAHCFTGTVAMQQAYLDRGLYIGVTGWLCDPKRGADLIEAVKVCPQERLILETDAPYLYPKTRKPRQRNNEPAYLPFIGETVAQLRAISPAKVANFSYANTRKLFKLER